MDEPDSSGSGSDVDQQPKTQDSHMESDESYSNSDSEETTGPKSMYNVYKTMHVPGKYKQSIDPLADQQTAGETLERRVTDSGTNQDSQTTEDSSNASRADRGAGGVNEEEVQAMSEVSAEQELDFTETGIFEKSMFVIPSMPIDEAEETKANERVKPKVPPPIPPKPSLKISLSSEEVDSRQTDETSPIGRPKPAPRKSKRLSETYSDDKLLLTDEVSNEQESPVPSPRSKRKSEEVDLPPHKENEKTVPTRVVFQAESDVSQVECKTFIEHSITTDVAGRSEKEQTNAEESVSVSLIDTVDIGSALENNTEESNTKDHTNKQETEETHISDTMMKDLSEEVGLQQPAKIGSSNESESGDIITDLDKSKDVQDAYNNQDDSDTENEENATFENDFQDTDSAKEDVNNDQRNLGSESDGSYGTADNLSEDEDYEYYDSKTALPIDNEDKSERDVKKDETESNITEEFDRDEKDSHTDETFDLSKSETEMRTDFEESVIIIGKGSVNEAGYVSMSSTITSGELTETTFSTNQSFEEKEEESKPASLRAKISMFESIGQGSKANSENRDRPSFEKSSRSSGSSSSFEVVLSRHESDESPVKVDGIEIGIVDLSHQDDVSSAVQQDLKNSDDSEDEVSKDETPPPVPPKSDLVLESLISHTVKEPANISSNSSAVEADSNVLEINIKSQGQQSYVTVPPSELQKVSATNRDSTIDVPETLETVQQLQRDDGNDVSSNIRWNVVTVEDVDDDSLEGEKPPPIPPKSEVVLESLKSFSVVDDPPNYPQESNAVERGNAGEDFDSDTDRSSTGHGMTDVLPNPLPPFATEENQPSQPFQGYGQQQYGQHQIPFYPPQQQFYYTDESGNAQYANPYAFYNPNMNPGMFYQDPNMPYYQQPPYYSHQNYGTAHAQTPKSGAEYSSHQYARPEDKEYEEVCQPKRTEHTKSQAQAEHRQSPSAEHRQIYNQGHKDSGFSKERKTDGTKLTKSKSDAQIKESRSVKKSSQSPVRRSVSNLTDTPRRQQDPRKSENKRKPKEVVVEKDEAVSKKEDYYIYFKGINPDTKRENLSNFMEVATKGESDPETIIFNHSRTCALVKVSMDQKPDLSKVEERIHKRGIDGEKPEVFIVESPDSIAVSSEEDIKSTESLGLYFESRKAAGAELKQDPYESEDGSCFVIQFGGPDVVKKVCARQAPHEFEGKKLRVSPYFKCEAGSIWDSELHVVKIPGPVVMSLQQDYLTFLQRDCCKQLLANLESNHCVPLFTDEGLKLECILTPKTPSFRTLVKKWEHSSRLIVDTYISENIVERPMQSSDQVWEELMTFFKQEKFQETQDLVTNEDKSSCVVLLVGFKDPVKDVLTKLGEKQKEIEKRLSRKTETIRFNALKLRLLDTVGVFEAVKKETDDIEIFIGDGDITVEGQPEDISLLQVRMYEAESKILNSKWEHGFSRDCVDFIQKKLIDNISSLLKRNRITAEWEISERYITIYVYDDQRAGDSMDDDYEEVRDDMYSNVDDVSTNARDLLKSAVVEMQEDVQDSIIEVLTSPEWTSFVESITEEYENVAEVEFQTTTTKIIIYGMKKEAQDILSKVKAFLEENAVKDETINCGTISVRFINMHRKELAATLENKFEHLKVRIVVNDENVVIRGTKAGIAETKKELMKVLNSIICDKYTIQKVAVKDVFRDVREQGLIDVVEKETGCLIKLPGENETFLVPDNAADDFDDSDDGYEVPVNVKGATGFSQAKAPPIQQGFKAPPIQQGFKAPNGVKVTLVKGELGQQDGDVIVVTTSPNLHLSSGNACKSVLRAGGQRLQDECKERYPDGIKFGDIAVIHGGGSLECNRVYLTSLPNWSSENDPKQVLEKIMKDSLELASKFKKYSIVFAAMGTGQLKYPTDLVAMLMYQAVIDFDQNNPQTTLKDVRFVLYQKDYPTIKGFEAEEQLRLEGGGDRPTFDLKQGNLTIELSVENIAQQKVDGILCSTSPNMELSRNGACQALLRTGGKSLQDECKSKYNNKLEEGQVVEIGGGKLSCKSVFLTVLPGFSPDAIGILTNVIQTVLKLAQAKGLTSLALPALGTGFLKYPKQEVCKCMFDTVTDWAQNNPNTTIKTIRFIMHAKDHGVIQMFKSYILNAKGRGKREGRHSMMSPNAPPRTKTKTEAPQKSDTYNAHKDGVQVGKIKLSVYRDDILSQKTDAIVSSVGNDFEFIGAVAQELKAKYPKVEEECKKRDKINKLKTYGVAHTKGFGLPAKAVVHVRFAEHLATWQERMNKCLEKANKKSWKSIAFPVLGTGKGFKSFNPEAIAGCLFDAVNEFVQANKSYSIKDVRLIVYKGQPAMFDPIMDKLHKCVQEAAVSGKQDWKKKMSKTFKKYGKQAFDAICGKEDGVMTEENRKKLMALTSSMEVHIYSDSQTNIDKCKKELDAKLEKAYTKRKIDDYKEVIMSLTKEETKLLDIVALANINIDTQAGIITIDGPMKQVSDVIHELKANLLKIERWRHDTSAAEELHKIVQWQYEEVTQTEFKLIPYSKKLNQLIEKAYKANMTEFEFEDDDGEPFVIDFQQLIEYRKSDDQDKLRVLRKDILKSAASALPEDWANMKDNENIKVVAVQPTDQTYKDIEQRFITEVKTGSYAHRLNFNPGNMQVNKIERIQNKTLFQQYQAKKKHMTEQKPNLPPNMPIEHELWHGTKFDAVTSIQMHGFNRSYSGNANGQPWYGDGVYFSANASYSARGWLSGAGSGSKGYMFLVKTLTGQFCKGSKGMRYLPAVDPKDPTLLYDCAVDDPAKPMEFVIFNDTQAYPAYIITFTT